MTDIMIGVKAVKDWLIDVWLVQGASGFSGWEVVLYTLAVTQVTIATVTLYLHRYGAHRSIDLHPALVQFFRFWLWLTTSMVPQHWVAVHRKHHANCETEDDPHSPQVRGISEILLKGVEYYRSAINPEMVERYGSGMSDDWLERVVYSGKYTAYGVGVLMAFNLLMFGPIGLTVWAIQMLWIPIWAAGVINGICHYVGYRNHECPDAATNITPWAFFIGGEELHNNHHTYPNSAKFSVKWWEFDIGWLYIRILSALGLAKANSTGPVVCRDSDKAEVDMATVRGIVNDRFHVLSQFRKRVLQPVAIQESAKSEHPEEKAALKRAPKLLARYEELLTPQDCEQMETIFSFSGNLKALYNLQQDLKSLWEKRDYSKEEMLTACQGWMDKAEQMGIDNLTSFSRDLRAYSLPEKDLQPKTA